MTHVTVLGGGAATAKLLPGLLEVLPEERIHAVVNVGDDCEALGLYLCPHLDAILLALAGERDPYREDPGGKETFHCLDLSGRLGLRAPFRIGDRALALPLARSALLRSGLSLEAATAELADRLGVGVKVMPAANEPVRTEILVEERVMPFREFAALEGSRPEVTGVRYAGAETARAPDGVVASILEASRVILASSDPIAGIGPILAAPGVLDALAKTRAMVIGLSPIVGSHAFGVATPHLLRAVGARVSAAGVAERYRQFLDFFVIHTSDLASMESIREAGLHVWTENIVLGNAEEAKRLAIRLTNEERLASPKAR